MVAGASGGNTDFDALLKPLGGFGKFQIINLLCLCSVILLCSFCELGYVMTTGQVKHRCQIVECGDDSYGGTDEPWLSAAIPKTSSGEYDSCYRYRNMGNSSSCSTQSFSNETYKCDSFIYESDEWTIAREDWGLHCDNDRYLLTLVGSLNNVGQVIGSPIVGFLADKFGRKVMVSMILFVSIVGVIKSYAVNYIMMVLLETLETTMGISLYNLPFVLGVELVDPSKRVLVGMLLNLAYPVGEMLLGLVHYLTLDWRTTIQILYFPFILALAFYWIVPESVRWLIDNNRKDEALAILQRIAKTNKREFPEEEVNRVLYQEATVKEEVIEEKPSLIDLCKSKIMRNRLMLVLFVWVGNTFVYFGLTVNSVSLSDDKFVNFILSGLIEMPAYILLYFLLDRWGRKICQSSSLILCGLSCLLDAYVPDGDSWSWAKLTLYLIGKFCSSISFFSISVFTTELFPTPFRSSMMALGLMAGKIFTILAPEVPLLGDLYKPLPLLLFGVLASAAGMTALTLPETLGSKLPDTIEEAENLGKNDSKENISK